MVLHEINRLHQENKIPIIEGGSGFYLNYLLTGSKQPYSDEEWNKASELAENFVKTKKDSTSM